MDIPSRVQAVRDRIAAACATCGRDPDSVGLVAVSKTHGPDQVAEAAACGLTVFGENRVQEAAAKIPLSPGHLTWHLVGHLQRNKAAHAIQLFDLIHSIDSLRLLETIDRLADEAGRTVKVLLEVNVSGEGTKFGLKPEEVPAVLEAANRFSRIEIRGLMTMPPASEDVERARPFFRKMRGLRDEWSTASGHALRELSMGMSHDLEVAIQEGSTWVRVGTSLFGQRGQPWKPASLEDS